MNRIVYSNVFRFLILALFQVLILKQLSAEWSSFPYVNILIYPLFILLLPLGMKRWAQFLAAFLIGIIVDIFYNSPGVHAGDSVFTIYLRPYVLSWLEPRGGYNVNNSPTKDRMGMPWFIRYVSILLLAHCIFYFSLEVFTPVLWKEILLKILFGYVFSLAAIMIITVISNPKD